MARIKVCGINEPRALAAALEAGADWVGLVFFDRSPRAVTPAAAARLLEGSAAAAVGLFVDPTDNEVDAALGAVTLTALQLYAPAARVAALAARTGLPVWQAVGVSGPADLPRSAAPAAYVLDAKPPADATRPGGNARRFDWSLLHGWQAPRPWLLAGGLTPENVTEAVASAGAEAVDVSSGVESAPGVKDPARIRAFVEAARRA